MPPLQIKVEDLRCRQCAACAQNRSGNDDSNGTSSEVDDGTHEGAENELGDEHHGGK